MTNPETARHIEIKDGDHTVAAAEVATSQEAGGTARASLHPTSGPAPPGSRANLVNAVMDRNSILGSSAIHTFLLGNQPEDAG